MHPSFKTGLNPSPPPIKMNLTVPTPEPKVWVIEAGIDAAVSLVPTAGHEPARPLGHDALNVARLHSITLANRLGERARTSGPPAPEAGALPS